MSPVLHDTRLRLANVDSTRKTDAPDVHPKGRTCTHCPAILSIYNPASICSPCQLSMRTKRLAEFKQDEHISYRRLMEQP